MKSSWCKWISVGAAAAMLTLGAEAATVMVTVHGVNAGAGNMLYATLYCGEPTWLDPKQVFGNAQVAVTAETLVLRFENVTPGGCAMNLYHDENGNGKLDLLRGPFPIPNEGVAVSNNAIRRGPPRYKQAEFQVREPSVSIDVKMNY